MDHKEACCPKQIVPTAKAGEAFNHKTTARRHEFFYFPALLGCVSCDLFIQFASLGSHDEPRTIAVILSSFVKFAAIVQIVNGLSVMNFNRMGSARILTLEEFTEASYL